MLDFWSRTFHRNSSWFPPLAGTYQVMSSASVDDLWQKVVNLADVSWHPLISSTNVPNGLVPKPGLIYQAFMRCFPIPVRIFVERVSPRELLSVRVFALPGVEERVTYRVESTVWGTRVSYSVTLTGWLSPLLWSLIRPHAARVAQGLVQAVEQELSGTLSHPLKSVKRDLPDLLSLMILLLGIEQCWTCYMTHFSSSSLV